MEPGESVSGRVAMLAGLSKTEQSIPRKEERMPQEVAVAIQMKTLKPLRSAI